MNHMLTIDKNPYGPGFLGFCECSDPDFSDGWSGQVAFAGDSQQEIIDVHHDHVQEEIGAFV